MAQPTAKILDDGAIPVIDISMLAEGGDAATRDVAAQMLAAAEGTGFFYVSGHGVPQALIDEVFAVSRQFFTSTPAAKRAVTVNPWHRGFIQPGEAKMYAGSRPDLKESFIWGLDRASMLAAPDEHGIPPNQWPDFLPQMQPVLNRYFEAVNEVGWRLLRVFAVSLGIAPDAFVQRITNPTSRGSIIYYPPQEPGSADDQFGVAPHTDWGCLTLLYQDQTGGLEVRGRAAEWVSAVPIPGTYVVNVGDLLARWTNDRFRSTPHRVINRSGRERLSCAVFIDPDRDTVIAPVTAGEEPHYPPVTCGDYVQSRFDAAFAYRQKTPPASA
jgi:isopenicillin N synthase-like dioxygenase